MGDTEVYWVRQNASTDAPHPHSTERRVNCWINYMLGATSDFSPCSSGFSDFPSSGFDTSSTKKKQGVNEYTSFHQKEWIKIIPSDTNKHHMNPCTIDCFPIDTSIYLSVSHLNQDQTDSLIIFYKQENVLTKRRRNGDSKDTKRDTHPLTRKPQ